uniref:Uncharacterized protein n=1 Tax=Roseihalotalea indica TaxID=2867963 RepID=A0AA49GQZ8_9BACT|nr:hypothetical protein K4G66_30770 [Tunicatimonas sp. TK19036]
MTNFYIKATVMADAPTPPNPRPLRELSQQMKQAGQQAEKLRLRAEALKKFAQRYKDTSTEQSQIKVPHEDRDP